MSIYRFGKYEKKIFAITLIIAMAVTYMPIGIFDAVQTAYAAGEIGFIIDGDHREPYWNFNSLVSDLDDMGGKTVTIEMNADWIRGNDSRFDRRLIIPSNCKATLNMNGHAFDRQNASSNDSSMNGELITVKSGATLTINGGDKTKKHSANVYTSTNRDAKASTSKEFYGGLLAGGASDNGAGGIETGGSSTLILNDVTIAGCRAHAPLYDRAGTNSAYGGGIWMTGQNCTLRMNNSTITGCFAYYDGGGIFQSNHDGAIIELNDSHVDANYAGTEGGGIDVDGEWYTIRGSGNSTISNNEAATDGGGVYLWNDEASFSGVTIEGNKAGRNGGGVYIQEEHINLSDLKVKNNSAGERGGGIYINNDGNTISSCEITENSAGISGGGVYVDSDVDVDFSVLGQTIIKDNNLGNLYFAADNPKNNRVIFNLTRGADVYVKYYSTGNFDYYQVNPDDKKVPNCIQYLTAENEDYHFTHKTDNSVRNIYYVRDGKGQPWETGEPVVKPDPPTTVDAADANDASNKTSGGGAKAGVIGQVGAGGGQGSDYDLVRGFNHYSHSDVYEDADMTFYYSDGFFYGDPYVFNEHLGTASLSRHGLFGQLPK